MTYIPLKDHLDLWKDIIPISQFSESITIARMNYPEEYKELMDYFRGIISKKEISLRVYELTTEVIKENATNYVAWYIRRLCIDKIKEINLNNELLWLDSIMVLNQKNYQIRHHRKVIIDKLNDCSHEKNIMEKVFKSDSKNFHAWTYRIWMIRRFNNIENEFEFIENLLNDDIKNNSVWNYRFFLVNYINGNIINNNVIEDEINYALNKIKICIFNESAYCYLRGWIVKMKKKFSDFPQIKNCLIELCKDSQINHIHSMLLDIYEEEGNKESFNEEVQILCELDYIRKKNYLWRKEYFNL